MAGSRCEKPIEILQRTAASHWPLLRLSGPKGENQLNFAMGAVELLGDLSPKLPKRPAAASPPPDRSAPDLGTAERSLEEIGGDDERGHALGG